MLKTKFESSELVLITKIVDSWRYSDTSTRYNLIDDLKSIPVSDHRKQFSTNQGAARQDRVYRG